MKKSEENRIERLREEIQREVRDTKECFDIYSQFVQTLREERVNIETRHSTQLYDYLNFSKKRLRVYGIAIRQRLENSKKQLDGWNTELERTMEEIYGTKTHEEMKRITQWITQERSEMDNMRKEVGSMETEFQALQPDEEDFKMRVPVPALGVTLSARRYVGYSYFIVLTFFTLFASGILESAAFTDVDPLSLELLLPSGIALVVFMLLFYQALLLGRREKLFLPMVIQEEVLAEKMKMTPLRPIDRSELANDILFLLIPLSMLSIVNYVIGSRLSDSHRGNPFIFLGTAIALSGLLLVSLVMSLKRVSARSMKRAASRKKSRTSKQ